MNAPEPAAADGVLTVDIALIGAGVASAFTLLQTLDRLDAAPGRRGVVRIAVIDSHAESWTGIAYGDRSSVNSLLIHSLQEFLPAALAPDFFAWLDASFGDWAQAMAETGGPAAEAWLARNAAAIAERRWGDLFLPRRAFGDFFKVLMDNRIRVANRSGRFDIRRITGEVRAAERTGLAYALTLAGAADIPARIVAGRVVLGIGSPPFRRFPRESAPECAGVLWIDDLYDPSLDQNMARIRGHLSGAPAPRTLVVVGSNASGLEMLYMLARMPDLQAVVDRAVCISHTGRLPEYAAPIDLGPVQLDRLERLLGDPATSSDVLFAAIEADIAALPAQNIRPLEAFPKISSHVVSILSVMDVAEVRAFHLHRGMAFTRMVRRAGAEYVGASEDLIACGRLQLVAGSFLGVGRDPTHPAAASYRPADGGAPAILPGPVGVVVNCSGFEDLGPGCSSPLVRQLIVSGQCAVNPTGRGLLVNDDFEAAPGLHVMGPLLAGAFTARLRTWHIENARRIFDSAGELAEVLCTAVAPSLAVDAAAS